MAISFVALRMLKVFFGVSFVATMTAVVTLTMDWKYKSADLDSDGDLPDEIVSASSLTFELVDDYHNCVHNPTKQFCLLSPENKLHFLEARGPQLESNSAAMQNAPESRRRHPMEAAISDFNKLMRQLDLEVVLIEPSILFCMLTSSQKVLLQLRGLDLASFIGVQNVVNFALLSLNSTILEMGRHLIESSGFSHVEVDDEDLDLETGASSGHHFFLRRLILVHLVVFFSRGHYLWHTGLNAFPEEVLRLTSADQLLFSAASSSFEKFYPMLLEMNDAPESTLKIPSRPSLFLLQMASSKFLECNPPRIAASKASDSSQKMEMEKLRRAFVMSLRQLKSVMHGLLVEVWIFHQTLTDWYYGCHNASYLTSAHFATWRTEDDMSLPLQEFGEKMCRKKVKRSTNRYPFEWSFSCTGHDVRLYFFYKEVGATWLLHRAKDGYVVKYKYPQFELCSTGIFGHRVLVPCNPEEMIRTDYGLE